MFRVTDPFEGWEPPTQDELRQINREVSEAALHDLAASVRDRARETPGWERHADKLGVYYDEGEPYMGLQPGDEDEEKVFDLEYGTPQTGPSGLFRDTLATHGPRIAKQMAYRITERITMTRGGGSHPLDRG